ncbi:MAG: pyruvate dehydrogenase (acetyl-transferring) E1 component subunit alpha, partial [Proteobacteria bacterium]
RTREEIEDWMTNRDPISLFEKELLEFGVIDQAGIEAVRATVEKEIADALEFARQSPMPDPADHELFVYTEVA